MLRDFCIGGLLGLWAYLALSIIGAACITRIRMRVNRRRSVAAEIGNRRPGQPAKRRWPVLSNLNPKLLKR